MIRRLILALVALAYASSASAALPGANGYQGENVVDVRAFGALCDGSTDDNAAFTRGYAKLNAMGGGTLVVPDGKTCRIGTDVQMLSKVRVRCGAGSVLKFTDAPTITLGMFMTFVSPSFAATDVGFEGCTFDLNGQPKPAIWLSGERFRVVGNRVFNGDTNNGSPWDLILVGPSGSSNVVENNTITCAGVSGANDRGLSINSASEIVAGPTPTNSVVQVAERHGTGVNVTDNAIRNCDGGGIINAGSRVAITHNTISVIGASGIGVENTGDRVKIANNHVFNTGTTGVGISQNGGEGVIEGNSLWMAADTAGTEAQTTIKLGTSAIGARIVGNTMKFVSWVDALTGIDENNVHVTVAAQHARIIGNYMLGGKYGVAPSEASAAERGAAINAYVDSNEIWGIGGIGVVTITGWMVANNYISWLEANAHAVVVGDVRGNEKLGNSHATINNNRLHSANSGAKGVVFGLGSASICDGQSTTRPYRACTLDTTDPTNGCPGSTCPGTALQCCVASSASNIVIAGNELLFAAGSQGPIIDIGAGVDANSQPITNVMIDGNSVSMDSNDTYISFPSSNQSKVTKVWVGDAPVGTGTFVANFTAAQGTLLSLDQVVADLPAAGCIGTSASSFWNLPASNPAVAACQGTNYVRGVLNFTDGGGSGATLSAFTDFVLPTVWLGTLYVDIWWGNNNTTACNVVWEVTGVCVTDDDGEDPAFSSTANTVTAAVDTTNALDVDKATITLSNAANNPLNTCAAGEVMHLRLYRNPSNASDTCTTSIASLYRAVVRQW